MGMGVVPAPSNIKTALDGTSDEKSLCLLDVPLC